VSTSLTRELAALGELARQPTSRGFQQLVARSEVVVDGTVDDSRFVGDVDERDLARIPVREQPQRRGDQLRAGPLSLRWSAFALGHGRVA
jgi:hypothetical protein